MIKRTKKAIRQLRGTSVLFKTDGDNIKRYFLPIVCVEPFFPEHDVFRKPECGSRDHALEPTNRQGDQPWPASNVASPVTPSTRKSSKPPRAITAGGRIPSGSPSRRSRRRANTPFGTASAKSVLSGRCGFSV